MVYKRIKRINGKEYVYSQSSHWVNGKVVTKHEGYHGPVAEGSNNTRESTPQAPKQNERFRVQAYGYKSKYVRNRKGESNGPYPVWSSLYNGSFNTREAADKKILELKDDQTMKKVSLYSVDLSKPEFQTSGRQLSSGVYYGKRTVKKSYPEEEIEVYRQEEQKKE